MDGDVCSLKAVRQCLGVSQNQLADMLGVSKRAVQSYEQGWRPCPDHVQKAAAMILYLSWRRDNRKQPPCWEQRNCKPERQKNCQVFRLKAGDLCWLLDGKANCGNGKESRKSFHKCKECPTVTAWLLPQLAKIAAQKPLA